MRQNTIEVHEESASSSSARLLLQTQSADTEIRLSVSVQGLQLLH